MGNVKQSSGRALTAKQLDVLRLLFRFRFATVDQMVKVQGNVTKQTVYARIKSLLEKKMIIQIYDGRARLEGRPAIYRLASKGAAVLGKDNVKYSPKVLHTIAANKDPSVGFMNRSLMIFSIFNSLNYQYGNDLIFLTKSNLAAEKFDYLPKVKPDAFMYLQSVDRYYFMYYIDDSQPVFAHVRRLFPLVDYKSSGAWENETDSVFPTILLIGSSKMLETTIRKRFNKLIDAASDIEFATTTLVDDRGVDAWKQGQAQGEVVSLENI